MQRLLDDATKLTGVKYDINNLSDVYNAIHAIQGKLDITGTTAKEAASTFSGSFDAMKASFKNVLANLAFGDQLMPSLSALVDTTSNFLLNNFIPMVTRIITRLPTAIGTILSGLASKFSSAGTDAAIKLGIGLDTGMSGIGSKMMTTIQPIITGFQTAFSQLPQLFTTIVNSIIPIIDTIAIAFTKLDFSGIQSMLSAIIPAITAGFSTMMSIMQPAIDMVVNSFVNLWNALQPIITALASALMPAFQILGAFLVGVFVGIMTSVSAVFNVLSGVISFLTPVFQLLVNVFKAIAPVLTVVAQWIGTLIGLFGGFGGAGTTLKTIMSNTWEGIKTVISTSGNIIKVVIDAIKAVFSALGSAGGSLKGLLSAAWNGIKSVISSAGSVIKAAINGVKSVFSALGSAGSSLKSLLSSAWSGIVSAVSSAKSSISGIVSGIKTTFNSLGKINLLSIGKNIVQGLINGINSMIDAVGKAIGNLANKVTSGIKGALKIHSPSRVTGELGMYTGAGFVNGIESMIPAAGEMSKKLANEVNQEMGSSSGLYGLDPIQINKITSIDFNQTSSTDTESTLVSQLNQIMDLLSKSDPQYQIMLDSGALVGELTPGVDKQLATNWQKNDNRIGR